MSKRKPTFRWLIDYSAKIVVLLIVLAFILYWKYYHEIKNYSEYYVQTHGFPALFFLTWLSDAIIQPVPADFFVFGSTFGGASLLLTATIAGLASSLGGLTGYYIGRIIGAKRFTKYFGKELLKSGKKLFDRYGTLAIVVSSISPIPYSGACYMGGIFRMSSINLFLASLVTRTIRYLLMGWLGLMA